MPVSVFSFVVPGILGLVVGSFAAHAAEAVVAHRELSRPRCPYCTAAYRPLQWSATVAYLTGQGRCRECRRSVRVPRLLGELYLALGWGFLVGLYGLNLRTLLAMATLLPQAMILVTDLEAKLVPNRIMLPSLGGMVVVGLAVGPAVPGLQETRWWYSLGGAATGFVVFRLLVWLGEALFGPGALGEGDITLATYVGAVAGFPLILQALVLTFFFGGVGALAVIVLRRGKLGTAIPYGPVIILGGTAVQLWGPEILRWFLG